VIISASRRTDIPAFFSEWFMKRIEEGVVCVADPFNPRQVGRFSLLPDDVDAIVFWSKNPRPLMARLNELDSRGYRYYFQFTLNDYPPFLEPNVPGLGERLDTLRTLSDRLGPERVVWRYDPIVVSSVTPTDYHLERLEGIASSLGGYTKRLVISLLDFYSKTEGRLSRLSAETGATFTDIALPAYRTELLPLARQIKRIGDAHGLEVYSCAEAVDLSDAGIRHGACIDGELIRRLFGLERDFRKDRGQRAECLCAESVDVGAYNTCGHLCAYCYASFSGESMRKNLARHDAGSPVLIG